MDNLGSHEVKRGEVKTGRAGELIAAGVVETFGYRSVLCQQAGFDMLLMRDDERHYRCEIKTRSVAVTDSNRKSSKILRYSWTTASGCHSKIKLNERAVDLLILVALDIRRCLFIPTFEHGIVRKHIKADVVKANDEKRQLDEALARIDKRLKW